MHLPSDAAQLCSCKNEGYVAVPATLRSCLGCLLRRCCTSKTRKRVDERSTRDFALAIPGIGDSCSGYAGFRSWLLYAGLLSVSLSLSLSLFLSLLLLLPNSAWSMALPDTQVLCEIFSHFAGAPGSKIEIARRSLIYVFFGVSRAWRPSRNSYPRFKQRQSPARDWLILLWPLVGPLAGGRCPLAGGWAVWCPVAAGRAGWCGGRCSLAAAPALIPGGRRWAGGRRWPAMAGGGRWPWWLATWELSGRGRSTKVVSSPHHV